MIKECLQSFTRYYIFGYDKKQVVLIMDRQLGFELFIE